MQRPQQRLKFENFLKQYQDTIVVSRGRNWWQTLWSAVRLRSQSSHFTAKWGDLLGVSTHRKKLSFWLFWSWQLLGYISFSPYGHYFCVLQRSLPPC